MTRMTIKALLVVAAMGGVAAIGCSGGGGDPTNLASSGTEESAGNFKLSATDAPYPMGELASLVLKVSSIEVHNGKAGEKEGWEEVKMEPFSIDLVYHRNGVIKEVANMNLPAGSYDQIVLKIEGGEVTFKKSEQAYPLTVPSGKVRLKFSEPIEVNASGLKGEALLDFDLSRSLVVRPIYTGLQTIQPELSPEVKFYEAPKSVALAEPLKLQTTYATKALVSYDAAKVTDSSLIASKEMLVDSSKLVSADSLAKLALPLEPVKTPDVKYAFLFKPVIRAVNRKFAGNMEGLIFDEAENPLENAIVTVVSQDGATVASAISDANGFFHIPGLPQGWYVITISKAGFKDVPDEKIQINAQQTHSLDPVTLVM